MSEFRYHNSNNFPTLTKGEMYCNQQACLRNIQGFEVMIESNRFRGTAFSKRTVEYAEKEIKILKAKVKEYEDEFEYRSVKHG